MFARGYGENAAGPRTDEGEDSQTNKGQAGGQIDHAPGEENHDGGEQAEQREPTLAEQARQPAVGHEPLESVDKEEGVEFGITRAEALGLGGEAVKPREADGLHPPGCIALAAGIDVESEADIEQPALVHFVFGPSGEFLLLGGSQADPDDIGSTGVDLLEDARPFVRFEVAVMGSADVELWIEIRRFFDEVGEAILGRT